MLKSPKFDLGALLNLHGESNTDEQGQKVRHIISSRSETAASRLLTGCVVLGGARVQGAGLGVGLKDVARVAGGRVFEWTADWLGIVALSYDRSSRDTTHGHLVWFMVDKLENCFCFKQKTPSFAWLLT